MYPSSMCQCEGRAHRPPPTAPVQDSYDVSDAKGAVTRCVWHWTGADRYGHVLEAETGIRAGEDGTPPSLDDQGRDRPSTAGFTTLMGWPPAYATI